MRDALVNFIYFYDGQIFAIDFHRCKNSIIFTLKSHKYVCLISIGKNLQTHNDLDLCNIYRIIHFFYIYCSNITAQKLNSNRTLFNHSDIIYIYHYTTEVGHINITYWISVQKRLYKFIDTTQSLRNPRFSRYFTTV